MGKTPCNCYSPSMHSSSEGKRKGVVFRPPRGLIPNKTTVGLDACIANVVWHLWANGVVTLSSCCGHGVKPPSLVLEESISPERAKQVRGLIAKIDARQFNLYSWKLVGV